jgi:hypothetical protein
MTTPDERTRSIVQAGAFLIELARDKTLPYPIRCEAARLARHYPTTSDVRHAALAMTMPMPLFVAPLIPDINPEWTADYKWGALRNFTRVSLPDPPEPRRGRKRGKDKESHSKVDAS